MHINYPSITKFQQLVELKDYRQPTKKEYVRYIRKLAEHFQCDPATLSENQIRQYFLFLRQHKHYSRSPMKMAKYALLCFYVECLQVSGWTVFREVRVAEPLVLPLVLSRAEVKSLLAAVREPRFRTCLGLMYHCGLRVGEAVRIEVKDILGRENPPRLLVRNGKGGKQRYVPITPAMVQELRAWWRIHQNPTFLFPTPGRGLQRVRHFGFLSAAAKARWQRVLALLDWSAPPPAPSAPLPAPLCPACKKPMTLIGRLPRAPPS